METELATLDEDFEDVFQLEPTPFQRSVFRLFDLPPELWLPICQYAVQRPSPMDITRARRKPDQCAMVRQPAVTRTCRLLRHELLPYYYRYNDFEAKHLCGVACIRDWFPAIGVANCRAMGTFTFHAEFQPDFWVDQFQKVGIDVKVSVSGDQTRNQRARFMTLVISF